MSSPSRMYHLAAFFAAATLCCATNVAFASPLIAFTDIFPNSVAEGALSDVDSNLAASWTQTTASSNVTLSAILDSKVGITSGDWYVTNMIGAGTNSANVVFTGTYNLTSPLLGTQVFDFNTAPRVVLGTGLNFAAGTYYLVLDGPRGSFINNANWIGDFHGVSTTLAPGFSLGDYWRTSSSSDVNLFAPASTFATHSSLNDPRQFVFELDSVDRTVPEPASLALFGLGLAGLEFSRRKKA